MIFDDNENEYHAGQISYFYDGKLHRTDGPAIMCRGDFFELFWYIKGIMVWWLTNNEGETDLHLIMSYKY